MRVPYTPLTESQFIQLLKNENKHLRFGNGLSDINIFKRRKLDPGLVYGEGFLGDLFSKLGPKILPLLRTYLLPFAKNVTGDILKGEKIKNSLKKRGLQSMREIGSKIISGEGRKRKRKRRINTIKKIKKGRKNKNKIKKTKRKTIKMVSKKKKKRKCHGLKCSKDIFS